MIKKILSGLLVVMLVSTLALAVEDDLVNSLDLSNAQVKQIRTQRESHVREQNQIREQLQLKEQALKEELNKEEPNQERIRVMVKEINQLRANAFESKINNALETKKVLTKEQLREMTKLQLKDGTGTGEQYRHRTKTAGDSEQGGRKVK